MKSKKRETVQGVLRQSIVQRDVNEMKASYNEIKKAAEGRVDSEWKRALTYAMHGHKVDMVFFAFETEDSKERDAIFEWIGDEDWIQKATFTDGSTLIHRAVAFRNRGALERMLSYGLDPYESSKDTDLVSIWYQEVSKMSMNEMVSSYERLQEAADALKNSERKRTLTRAMHDHKVEMLCCAFGTREEDERNAIIDWINDKKWIQTAKYEGGPTLMQRAVHSQNLKALERMICYRVEPEESTNNHQLVSDSDEVKTLKSETRDKVMEILKLQYIEHLHKLAESQDMSITDRSELINSMLFFSTSMHDVSVGMNLAIEHLQSKKLKDFIQEGLDMATCRCFVYEKRDRDLFIKLIVQLEKRCLLSEEDKCKFLSEATTVNTENTDWVRGMKASIQKLDERLTSTEKGLKTLQNSYTGLVAALQEKDERDAENEKIRLAISLTCASLALFGGVAIKELLEVAIFVNDPGLVLDAITDKSEDVVNEIVIKEGVKHVLEKAHISPGEFVAKLEEAKARMDAENEEGSDQEDADETSSRDGSAGVSQSDAADEHLVTEDRATDNNDHVNQEGPSGKENEPPEGNENSQEGISLEDNKINQDTTKRSRNATRLPMADDVKMIQQQVRENNREKHQTIKQEMRALYHQH